MRKKLKRKVARRKAMKKMVKPHGRTEHAVIMDAITGHRGIA